MIARHARDLGALVTSRYATELSVAELAHGDAELLLLAGFDEAGVSALAQGGRVIAAALGLRPGEGTGCGLLNEHTPVLLVSARPEAAFAASRCLLRPCLDRLTGAAAAPAEFRAPLTRKIASSVGVAEVALLRATAGGLDPLAAADLSLAALCAADAWLLVAADREGYAAGEVVEAFAV